MCFTLRDALTLRKYNSSITRHPAPIGSKFTQLWAVGAHVKKTWGRCFLHKRACGSLRNTSCQVNSHSPFFASHKLKLEAVIILCQITVIFSAGRPAAVWQSATGVAADGASLCQPAPGRWRPLICLYRPHRCLPGSASQLESLGRLRQLERFTGWVRLQLAGLIWWTRR